MDERAPLLNHLAARMSEMRTGRPLLVGVDGTSGSGKTVFASALAEVLRGSARSVIVASSDDFHHPRAVRYRQGKASARGFFEDSYDYERLRAQLLDAVRGPAPATYRLKAFDHRLDVPVASTLETAASDAILVFEGLFLHRSELRHYWDFSLFLQVAPHETFRRMAIRDGCPADPFAIENRRYLLGEQIYLDAHPQRLASVVIDNSDVARPRLVPAA